MLIHGPAHASWLKQIEIDFSILQCKTPAPNDFKSIETLKERLQSFQCYYEQIANPFDWKFTRTYLNALLNKIKLTQSTSKPLAA